jgi:hypothetical protein
MKATYRIFRREILIVMRRWALAEMPPCHPDVPEAVIELHALLEERKTS